jgi:hypothetical protein
MLIKQEIIRQIDRAIGFYENQRNHSQYDDLSDLGPDMYEEVATIISATIERLAPDNSPYRRGATLQRRVGSLRALRRDYDEGYLSSIQSLVPAELFTDFIEMAEHLLDQGYKDPAAVLVGGVLEQHLRALCNVRSIATSVTGRPKKADAMNNELGVAGVYNKLDQKNVTAWLDLRNKAAHGEYGQYTSEQVRTRLSGILEFAARVPAV